MKRILFFLVAMYFSMLGCTKKECREVPGGKHQFEIPVSLSPVLDTFQINDTIHVKSEFEDQVYDRVIDKTYNLEGFDFHPLTVIRKLDTLLVDESALDYFEVLIDSKFEYSIFQGSNTSALVGAYNYEDSNYLLEFRLVPKKKGLYFFSQSSEVLYLGDDQDFSGKCKDLGVDVVVYLNNKENNNVELLLESSDSVYSENLWRLRNRLFYDDGGYCFYVVD